MHQQTESMCTPSFYPCYVLHSFKRLLMSQNHALFQPLNCRKLICKKITYVSNTVTCVICEGNMFNAVTCAGSGMDYNPLVLYQVLIRTQHRRDTVQNLKFAYRWRVSNPKSWLPSIVPKLFQELQEIQVFLQNCLYNVLCM